MQPRQVLRLSALGSGKVTVDVTALADPHYKHQQGSILNLVDNPIIADADAVKGEPPFQGPCVPRSRVFGQSVDLPGDAATMWLRDSGQRIRRRRLDFDSVGHR